MNTALETANYFLSLAEEHGDALDQLKLQKLCYYAQGYNLAMRGEALFGDPIEAWDKGPVVRGLRPHFARYGVGPVPADASFDRKVFGVMEGALLHAVYREFRDASGSDLVTATHAERPWQEARRRGVSLSPETMREYFLERLECADAADRAAPVYEHSLEESFARSADDVAARRYRPLR